VQNFLRQVCHGFPLLPPTHKNFDNLYMECASILIEWFINEGLDGGPNRNPQSRQGKRRTWWGLKQRVAMELSRCASNQLSAISPKQKADKLKADC
jgi:hypothetical protein